MCLPRPDVVQHLVDTAIATMTAPAAGATPNEVWQASMIFTAVMVKSAIRLNVDPEQFRVALADIYAVLPPQQVH
jgi:hypothetical protein